MSAEIMTTQGAAAATAQTAPTLQLLLTAAADLAEARAGLAIAHHEEQRAASALDATRIECEIAAITEAGGEKMLGPNEAAQKRTLAARLEACPAYQQARTNHAEAVLDRRLAESDVELTNGNFQALLAALQQGMTDVPLAWFELPGQARMPSLTPSGETAAIDAANALAETVIAPPPAQVPAPSANGTKYAPAA